MSNPRSEPPFIDRIMTYPRDPISSYAITVTEWSDGEYTVLASKRALGDYDIIIEDETVAETGKFPSEGDIELCISERLTERFRRFS